MRIVSSANHAKPSPMQAAWIDVALWLTVQICSAPTQLSLRRWLPLARRDVERLRQVMALQKRLHDLSASPRAHRALTHRETFRDALTWLEIHGAAPEAVEHWKGLLADNRPADAEGVPGGEPRVPSRRRRRRRRIAVARKIHEKAAA